MRDWKSLRSRRALGVLTAILLLLGLAFVGPDWYWAWVGRHNHEASYQGRPTRYWSALLRRDFFLGGHLSPGTQKFLGIGGNPAVLQGDPAAVPVLLDL